MVTEESPASLHPCSKDQQLGSYPWTTPAPGELCCPLGNFSSAAEQIAAITAQKQKEHSFILPASSHPPSRHSSVQKGIPQLEYFPRWGRVGRVTSFCSPSRHHMKELPTAAATHTGWQGWDTERARSQEEKQGLPVTATP